MNDRQPESALTLNWEQTSAIMAQIGFLRESVLTIISAAIPNKPQCEAVRRLVERSFADYEPRITLSAFNGPASAA